MKAALRSVKNQDVTYEALVFVCPGCVAGGPEGYDGVHMLAVNSEEMKPSWEWNGDLEKPTLSPSILTQGYGAHKKCHSFLKDGVFEFLTDSEHPLSGQKVPIPDLPDWAAKLPGNGKDDHDGD